jgi:hypothetical protein
MEVTNRTVLRHYTCKECSKRFVEYDNVNKPSCMFCGSVDLKKRQISGIYTRHDYIDNKRYINDI